MNIWDSVQRGLEKATQEAARIARAQRLRSSLEGLSKQIETQQGAIILKAMELFKSGQLPQGELFVLCQELSNFQQQFIQAQSELKQMQSQSNQGAQTAPNATVAYTQQPYQPYDNTLPSLVPPPPPGVEPLTISSRETMRMAPLPPATEQTHCAACQAVLVPGNAFCHNCGTPVNTDASYQPTVRGSIGEGAETRQDERTILDVAEHETVRAEEDDKPLQEKQQYGRI
ncbi:MAG: hypothetical protein NVS4B11_15310 [Ktedonobacteraceae bacterium]